ncbi:hypothetical protein L1987_43233 [Smallanthus sonchifolius]|uniref:Uncharacterized protein n=1 Tax=Smallanthus sonchifolius TaxID=185202 RepID=A0ACB9GL00_9ASTR|nr:hypothetical protein L1987_43233 [Smallanthus sonchifolius]
MLPPSVPALISEFVLCSGITFENGSFHLNHEEDNTEADALANLASALKILEGTKIPIIHILSLAIEKINEVSNTKEEADIQDLEPSQGSWISPIKKYLQDGEIPSEEKNHKAFRMRVSRFIILHNVLYRKSIAGPYLRCLEDPEACEVLKDIHEGDCGNHTGGKALLSRILRTGYYWPTMRKDAMTYSQKYDACQRHSNILQKKIEAEAFVQIREKEVISFIIHNILTRFGIPAEIVCDNGPQFIGKRTTNFCASWGFKMITSTPVHPQANGQAESNSKIIINNLKKRLGAKKGRWAEELPFVLWVDKTTLKNATGQNPFSLVFSTEAMIPTEMVIPTARTNLQTLETNNEALAHDLDIVDEIRDFAKVCIVAYQQRIAKSYNKNIRIRRFQVGDLVLRKAFQNTTNPIDGKLTPKWEGPYLIDSEAGKGSYWLATTEGDILPRSWNAIHLKDYFM